MLKNGTEVARFAYDALGRRVEKVAAGVTHKYVYAGEDILQVTAGTTVARYLHGPGIDEPLALEIVGGARYYYHADGLGSVVLVTDAARTPVWLYRYDSFGQIQIGGTTSGYAFTGREWDSQTGLYYYRARYYDPKAGRFISEDPIRFTAGLNFYAYVDNDPLSLVDPSGLEVQECFRPMRGAPSVSHPVLYSSQAAAAYGFAPKGAWGYVSPWFKVPGKIDEEFPYNPDGTPKREYSCSTVSTDDCVERCVVRKARDARKKPPKYNLGKYQCNNWTEAILSQCKWECEGMRYLEKLLK